MKIRCLAAALICALLFCLSGCNKNETYTSTGVYFDTVVTLTAYGTPVPKEALELCRRYDSLLSPTNENSDVYILNVSGEYGVQKETADIIKTALRYCEESKGKFDITVRPLSALWNFGTENPTVPKEDDIKSALAKVDYNNIEIKGNTVTLKKGAQIDLGGIAKGYIADKILEIYNKNSVSGIIDLGGNILTAGEKPNKKTFAVGIKKPYTQNENIATVELYSGSVATCGVYERYFEADNNRYHHILDTASGYPVENGLDSVTVIAESSTDADALSTLLFVLGEEKAQEYLQIRTDVHGVFIRSDGTLLVSQGLEIENGRIYIK